ncbi:glyoxalase/bleomycin resistance protein/dioxygenase [Natronococcus amylolyticus DSM 10524]|uniref:Glyoxalase/bleomycin resistance protein/dioxygenase n=1 Tax=Natronococcus amylolyticus DSM 10524 TaxID=1227497 RepID=L9XJ74_9EURY|nr:VOC family protein [Natronococcus amylolyticus]ELY61461.1 glyoxalase/bleomycin resistance protein/dioxygenase [Natronococcus amylolyticus DSM 10524]
MTDAETERPSLVGINHVALEVGDIDDALEFYEDLFAFELRSRSDSKAFLDMGDQFIALAESDDTDRDGQRHFGLVVDDADAAERRLEDCVVERLDVPGLEFHDPWGNRVQLVDYSEIQFTKADHVLEGMGLDELEKTDGAIAELEEKGLAPERSD